MYKIYQKLKEAPIPDDWDKETINKASSFNKVIKSIVEKSKKLGTGSSRIAFEVNQPGFENTVIKVAKNSKGLAQNRLEEELLRNNWYDEVLPKLIDSDTESSYYQKEDSPLWIQVEKAQKATPKKIKEYLGIKDIFSFHIYLQIIFDRSTRRSYQEREEDFVALEENEWIQELIRMIGDYDMAYIDLVRPANLGFIDGELKIIDAGASKEIIKTYYFKGRR